MIEPAIPALRWEGARHGNRIAAAVVQSVMADL